MSGSMESTPMIAPTLCVRVPPRALGVRMSAQGDAERHSMHSHAERGNDRAHA